MKSQRQAKILEIIGQKDIETQEQLLAALEENGFRSTQATISRDIKDLRIVKELSDSGSYRYTVQQLLDVVAGKVAQRDFAHGSVAVGERGRIDRLAPEEGIECLGEGLGGGQHGYQLCGGHHCRRRYGADSDAGFRLCQRIL